jgi:Tol biopolymer transport system component
LFSRCLLVCLMLASALLPVDRAVGDVPEGPRLAVVTNDARHGSQLITIGPGGESPQALIDQPASDRPSWSADGGLLALAATGDEWEGFVVAVAGADGSGLRIYRRAVLDGGSDPVLSPDGRSVVYARAKLVKVLPGRENYLFKGSIWSLDLADGSVRQRTRWRLGFPLMPSSLSPDGSTLAATGYASRGQEAVAVDLRTGRTSLLAREASEPTYSPDGSEVAFIRWRNWRSSGRDDGSPPINELRIARVGAFPHSRLLLRRRSLLAWPSWDPSGNRLAFTSSAVVENGYSGPEEGDKLMAVNADGTCPTRILTDPEQILFGSAWQPGVGREAGPISC